MPRHKFTQEECRLGGKRSALHPDRKDMCSKGFWACLEKHPEAWYWLKKKIKKYNESKGLTNTNNVC